MADPGFSRRGRQLPSGVKLLLCKLLAKTARKSKNLEWTRILGSPWFHHCCLLRNPEVTTSTPHPETISCGCSEILIKSYPGICHSCIGISLPLLYTATPKKNFFCNFVKWFQNGLLFLVSNVSLNMLTLNVLRAKFPVFVQSVKSFT